MKRLAIIASLFATLALLTMAGCPSSDRDVASAPRPIASYLGAKPVTESTPTLPAPLKKSAVTGSDEVVATINGQSITLHQLDQTLLEGYGLNVLLNVAQLEIAKQQAAQEHVTVSPEDITAERDSMMATMFKDADKSEYPQLLDQLLQNQRVSRPEFEIVVQTNTYLRKIAEPKIRDKVTEDQLQEGFRALYGETIKVRFIQLANLQDIGEAKRRLVAGESFELVAKEMSQHAQTRGIGGELPQFSRYANYPQAFKDAAFALKKGEVSDPVQLDGYYHLIKLEDRFAPKAVKFEDVRDSLREELIDRLLKAGITTLRDQIAVQTRTRLTILDPTLKKQYENKITEADKQIKDKNEIQKQLERERQKIMERNAAAASQPSATTTTPLILPASTPATENLRPPATKPGTAPGTTSQPVQH